MALSTAGSKYEQIFLPLVA